MLKKIIKSDMVWIDKERNIYNENFSLTRKFFGITFFKKTVLTNHSDEGSDKPKMGFKKHD